MRPGRCVCVSRSWRANTAPAQRLASTQRGPRIVRQSELYHGVNVAFSRPFAPTADTQTYGSHRRGLLVGENRFGVVGDRRRQQRPWSIMAYWNMVWMLPGTSTRHIHHRILVLRSPFIDSAPLLPWPSGTESSSSMSFRLSYNIRARHIMLLRHHFVVYLSEALHRSTMTSFIHGCQNASMQIRGIKPSMRPTETML